VLSQPYESSRRTPTCAKPSRTATTRASPFAGLNHQRSDGFAATLSLPRFRRGRVRWPGAARGFRFPKHAMAINVFCRARTSTVLWRKFSATYDRNRI